MKFKSIKTTEIPSALAKGGGAVLGLMLPKMASDFAGDFVADVKPDVALTPEQVKKQKNTKLIVNGGFVVLGLAAALSLDGKDDLAQATKIAAIVSAATGALGVVKHFAQPAIEKMQAGTVKTLISSGLGCPCEEKPSNPALNRALKHPALKMPLRSFISEDELKVYSLESAQDTNSNPLG